MLYSHRCTSAASMLLFATAPSAFGFDSIVVFNEINYNPAGAATPVSEFVELYNQNGVNIDMSGWRLTGGIDYTFPQGTVIDGGGYIVIASDPAAIPGASGVLGPFVGSLDNGGETIRLRNNNRRVMDELSYDDRSPWPIGSDGSGATLSKRSPMRTGAVPEHWTHSFEIGGTPGTVNFPDSGVPSGKLPLWINEVSGTASGDFWVELFNSGETPLDLEGSVLAFADAGDYVFPAGQNIEAGEWLVIESAALGLSMAPADGESLYLFQAGKMVLQDAVRIDDSGIARVPDGGEDVLGVGLVAELSPGVANAVSVPDSIVINEIMYNHRPQYEEAGVQLIGFPLEVVGWNREWRFNQAGDSLGSAWASNAHGIGGSWEQGPGPFGFETRSNIPPEPIVTNFRAPASNFPRVVTYYLETEFDISAADLADVGKIRLTHAIDDGAIFYINGQEVARYDMPDGAVNASTFAENDTSPEADANRILEIGASSLVAGQNRLSVEVHQSSLSSSDMVMAMKVDLESSLSEENPPVPFMENGEEWVELHNPTAASVDVGGWTLHRAVTYEFPLGTTIPAGGYLVVPNRLNDFTAKFPGVPAVGGYSGSLSNRQDRLILRDPFDNTVDEVAYFDGKPWPSFADGSGSSIELRHPEIDNSIANSWAASDNSVTSSWQNYEYTLTAEAPTFSPAINGFHELRLGLLDAGEILIDDVSVVEDPNGANLELIANSSFTDAAGWRLLGTHQDSEIVTDSGSSVLKLVAVDRFNYLNNLIESNLTSGGSLRPVVHGTEYRIRFRAKWLAGSPQFRFELYYNKLAALVVLDQPAAHGTPGAQNSTYSAALGPDLSGLIHHPAVPSSGEAVKISVHAADPDGLSGVALRYAVNAGSFQGAAMSLGADGRHQAIIPSQRSGAKVQFYVQATDTNGNTSFAPPLGPDSRAIIEFDSAISGGGKQSIRINMLTAEANALHDPDLLLDNKPKGCTIITDEKIIAYDAAMRLRGSMFSRRGSNTTGLNLKFPADRRFRDLHSSVHVKRGDRREILVKHMINVAGEIHDSYNDVVMLDGHISGQSGPVRLEMARFGRNYLRGLPGGDGTSGTVFKMEGIRVFQSTQDGSENTPKIPLPVGWVGGFDLADQGADKEDYRHNIRINSSLDRDDYTGAIAMCQVLSLRGQELEDAAPLVIDVDSWTRKFAMMSLCGITDSYSQGDPHNFNFYANPEGLVEAVPWDWDHTFERSTTASLWGNRNVSKLFARPVYSRLFHGHLLDIINTTFNEDYISDWVSHLGGCAGENYSSAINYITSRSSHVLSELPSQVPFILTTNGGANFSVDESSVTLSGNGWINVRELVISGFPEPFVPIWSSGDSWQVEVPVGPGTNMLEITAIDHQGNAVGNDAIIVTNTSNIELASSSNLVVSEIHYHPETNADEEFVEVQNIHPSANINLGGVIFTRGIEFEFPANTILAPGARLLIVRNLTAFTAANGSRWPIVGSFENSTALSNSGETIALEAPGGVVIQSFTYDDKFPWPESPDGGGASLVLVDPMRGPDHSISSNWRPSVTAGGNPGSTDATTFPGGDLLRYAFLGNAAEFGVDADGHLLLSFQRNLAADDIYYAIETSTDMVQWDEGDAMFTGESLIDLGAGVATMSFRSAIPVSVGGDRIFVRILVSER